MFKPLEIFLSTAADIVRTVSDLYISGIANPLLEKHDRVSTGLEIAAARGYVNPITVIACLSDSVIHERQTT